MPGIKAGGVRKGNQPLETALLTEIAVRKEGYFPSLKVGRTG